MGVRGVCSNVYGGGGAEGIWGKRVAARGAARTSWLAVLAYAGAVMLHRRARSPRARRMRARLRCLVHCARMRTRRVVYFSQEHTTTHTHTCCYMIY